MFEKVRLKLTAFYLLIIMTISLSFSAFVYQSVNREFQRRFNVIENRLQAEAPPGWRVHGPIHNFFLEDLDFARKRVLFLLLYANGTIFILSAAAGYFLAGKTLEPIEKAMDEQKRFVADASHELKTPLTALQTSIEVALRDKKLNLKNAKKVLAESLDDISNLTNLSNNLLTLARMQSNGQVMKFEKLDIKNLIEEVVEKLQPIARKKGIVLKSDVKSQMSKVDRENFQKLITILLDNAIKYTPKGGKVNVLVENKRNCVIIKVKDTGVGITKKDLPHIFDRFYRVDASRSKVKTDGFGLGLSIAKRVVKLHKGSIKTESKVGEGSTFTVKLPLSS